jgi:hypothetical protein
MTVLSDEQKLLKTVATDLLRKQQLTLEIVAKRLEYLQIAARGGHAELAMFIRKAKSGDVRKMFQALGVNRNKWLADYRDEMLRNNENLFKQRSVTATNYEKTKQKYSDPDDKHTQDAGMRWLLIAAANELFQMDGKKPVN